MEHYKNLLSALGGSMPVCMVWLLAGTEDNYFNARDVFAFALSEGGEEEELEEGQFYVVSAEGAIGLAVNYEYLTRWIFIPVVEEEIIERELERMREELAYDKEHENDEPEEEDEDAEFQEEQPVPPQPEFQPQDQPIPPRPVMQPQGQPIPPQPMMQPQGQPIPPQPMMQPQGQPIPPQPMIQPQGQPQPERKKFCVQCGHQLNVNAKFCPKCGNPVQR